MPYLAPVNYLETAPNVLGVNPSAEEALWNPGGGESWYMPIVPCKKGFKSVTLYNPEACKVERLLKDKGYWEGGSISSIFTPTLGERSKSIGSGTLSAVNDPSFKNTIRGLDAWSKRLLSLSVVGGTAAALSPGEARAFVPVQDYRARGIPADEYPWSANAPGYVNREPGLGTPLVDVADLATAPVGAVTAAGRAASVLAEPVISWGMDKAGNWLGDRLGGLLGYFGGEE